MRKSKPVLIAAGLIWVLVALAWAGIGQTHRAEDAILHGLTEYVELFLFLLPAMTYINALEERDVFPVAARFSGVARLFAAAHFLDYRHPRLPAFPDRRQPHYCVVAGCRGRGGRRRQSEVHHFGLYQRRRGGECRWRLLAVRRHYHPDGLAEREGGVSAVLHDHRSVRDQLGWCRALVMHFAVADGMPAPGNDKVVMKHGAKVMTALSWLPWRPQYGFTFSWACRRRRG